MTYLFGDSALTLTFVYVVLVLPYAYRAIDAGLSGDRRATLAEAARRLGAGWATVIVRVVLPNIWPGVAVGRVPLGGPGARRVHHRLAAQLRHLQVVIDLLGKCDAPDLGGRRRWRALRVRRPSCSFVLSFVGRRRRPSEGT